MQPFGTWFGLLALLRFVYIILLELGEDDDVTEEEEVSVPGLGAFGNLDALVQ